MTDLDRLETLAHRRIPTGAYTVLELIARVRAAEERARRLAEALRWIDTYADSGGRYGDVFADVREKARAALAEDVKP